MIENPKNIDEMHGILAKYFVSTTSKIELAGFDSQGRVDMPGNLIMISIPPNKKLPLQFGYVDGSFNASGSPLVSLEGSPHTVQGDFNCSNTSITTLDGAPNHVDGDFFCYAYDPLESMNGAPSYVGGEFWIKWSKNLPILRLLQYKKVDLAFAPDEVQEIIQKYLGTGKKGMLGAAAELTKAGFRDNARW
jgi:hypothetical protein